MLVLDPASGKLFAVALNTGERTVAASQLPATDFSFDSANNRILMTEHSQLTAMDLNMIIHTVLLDGKTHNDYIVTPSRFVADNANNRLLMVADRALFALDPNTGSHAYFR